MQALAEFGVAEFVPLAFGGQHEGEDTVVASSLTAVEDPLPTGPASPSIDRDNRVSCG